MKRKIKNALLVTLFLVGCIFVCSSCTKEEHTHQAESNWSSDSNSHWQKCNGCDDLLNKTTHIWDNGQVTVEPTVETEGEKTYTCTVCLRTKTEVISKLEPVEHKHQAKNDWFSDSSNHWQECNGCDELLNKTAHTWNQGEVTLKPTVEAEGEKTFTCTICLRTKTEVISKLEPEIHEHEPKSEWSNDESNHWQECVGCSELLNKEGHSWNLGEITTEPTIESEGLKTFTCTVCLITKTEPIDRLNPELPEECNFKTMSETDLKTIYQINDEVEDYWFLDNERGLIIISQHGELFQTDNNCKNIFLQNGKGDYIVETKIKLNKYLNSNFQQGGLIIYDDNDNYVKLVYAFNGEAGIQFAYEKDGVFTSPGIANVATDEVWLRIKKEGNIYTAFYTSEGPYSGFQELGSCQIQLEEQNLGMTAFNGFMTADSIEFAFEYMHILDVDAPATPESKFAMEIDKTEVRLMIGQQAKVTGKAIGEGDAGVVSYRSSDPSVVTIDKDGNITAIGEGYALITANVEEGSPAFCAVSVMPEELYVYESLSNPYLPLWEHIPDGEPYVFEDPDNPGKYRVYVYGSHDTKFTHYCGYEQVVWSAPIEDLNQWTYHGIIFKSTVQGTTDTLYAPDMAEVINADGSKTYYFYPNNQTGGRRSMVCKSSRPDGPFIVSNWEEGSTTKTEGPLGFDVAVLRDDDGRAYGYWGFENNEDCCWAELDPNDMATLKEGTVIHRLLPTRTEIDSPNYDPTIYNIVLDENVNKWGFFEAPSIRKVGNKYVLIFSRRGLLSEPTGCNTAQLAYGYSDSPAGPWKWGGIIVDANGETIPNGNGTYLRSIPSDNTHGSICEINGQWYIFYHRGSNKYNRQSMADPITVEYDTKPVTEGGEVRISQAEVTSKGFHLDGLNPYRRYNAGIICFLTPANTYDINLPDTGANATNRIDPVYDKNLGYEPVRIRQNNTIAGIKYFNFNTEAPEGESTKLALMLVPKGKNVDIDVYLRPKSAANTMITRNVNGKIISVGTGSIKVGTLQITSSMEQKSTLFQMDLSQADSLDGEWGLFFVFSSSSTGELCEMHTFEMFTDELQIEEPDNTTMYDFSTMTEEELKNDWEIVREDKEHWALENEKGLVLNNQQGGLYAGGNSCENIFLHEQQGDFTLETKINLSANFSQNWQQFNLLIYQDDDNYLKATYGVNDNKTLCQFLGEVNGQENFSHGHSVSTQEIWLRIVKVGSSYSAYMSTNGSLFVQIGDLESVDLTAPKIGFAAHNDGGSTEMVDITVEYIKVS